MKAWSGRPRATFARLTSIKSGRIDSPCTNHAQKKIVRKSVVLYLHRAAVTCRHNTSPSSAMFYKMAELVKQVKQRAPGVVQYHTS